MLYSVGKDSSVHAPTGAQGLLPGASALSLPAHRHRAGTSAPCWSTATAWPREYGLDLLVHSNEEAARAGVNPFDTETGEYSRLMLTEALKAALDRYGFDAAIGGGRRDEEKSRAKERDLLPSQRRPCLGSAQPAARAVAPVQCAAGARRDDARLPAVELDRARCLELHPGRERFPIVPLYLAAERQVVERGGTLIMVDDERMRLQADGEAARRAASASARWAAGR